jgi:hypothetical protein
MANNGESSISKDLRKDIQSGSDEMSQSLSAATLRTLSANTLEKLKDSVIENMGALQFLIDREQTLKGYLRGHQELLRDCRIIVEAHGHKALVGKIDRAIQETYEPALQT